MNYILFDDSTRNNLLPFTFTRPVADIRVGILTIREKWERYVNTKTTTLTERYLQKKFPLIQEKENILINGSILPDAFLVQEINNLSACCANHALVSADERYIIAIKTNVDNIPNIPCKGLPSELTDFKKVQSNINNIVKIENLWDIFKLNGIAIQNDFEWLTKNRTSAEISPTNNLIKKGNIFVENNAKLEYVTLNASEGPIYIGKNAEIMEGSLIRGPFALCEGATIKMGAKIYGPTTIGPFSKAGGEINNSVIFAYTNKAHDGFLGNSVIGEWCNIGADTNNSNLKNNYANVKLWNYQQKQFIDTGLQFCGLFMGDHSKCAINTMFNTGTIVGICSNIFGGGFPRNFIPDFSWGGPLGFTTYHLDNVFLTAQRVIERRGKVFDNIEKEILTHVFEITKEYRFVSSQ